MTWLCATGLGAAVDCAPYAIGAVISDQAAVLGGLEQPIPDLLLAESATRNDLIEVIGAGIQRIVASASRRRGDGCALLFQRGACPSLITWWLLQRRVN